LPLVEERMSKPRAFVTRVIPDAGLGLVLARCDAEIWEQDTPPPRRVLQEKVAGCEGLLTMLTDGIDGELMELAGPQLKVISNMAVGYDNIDVAEATRRGVLVGNTPGVLTETTADLAFSLLCGAARRIVEGVDYILAGRWTTWGPKVLLGYDLHGATLGLIGFGRIGQAMARRARGFDMKVLYFDPAERSGEADGTGAAECESLDDLLGQSDFVSIHTPLTEQTHHLLNRERLSLMKRTAILINSARGGIVDPDALFEALRDGVIAYAALDVTVPEPLPRDHRLMQLPNCLIVPHIGSASHATRNRMAVMAAENLLAGLEGERPPNLVNPEALGPVPSADRR